MNIHDKKEYAELLEDVCCDYCEPKRYCILKEFLISSHPSKRILFQLKAIDKIKFELSKERGKNVEWQGAMEFWVEQGWAKKFADVYEDDIKFSVLYKKLRHEDPKNRHGDYNK